MLRKPIRLVLLAVLLVSLSVGCDGDSDGGEDAGGNDPGGGDGDGDGDGEGNGDGDGDDEPLLSAPEAEVVGTLELDHALSDVVYAEELAIGLHAQSGASLLDLSDPENPRVISTLQTHGRAIAVTFDAQLRVLYIATVSGDLRAYRVGDVENPTQVAQSTLSEPDAGDEPIQGMVRVGRRLYALGQSHLLTVSISIDASGSVGFAAEMPVELDAGATMIAHGGRRIYIAFGGGRVQTWNASVAPGLLGEVILGGAITGWAARGHRIMVALRSVGLRMIDLRDPGAVQVVYETAVYNDIEGLERFGHLVLVALRRGLLVALDLSDFSAPRALAARSGTLPPWIAAVGGNVVLGGGTQLSVLGIPPFVSASVPALVREAFPRYGRIPLQLSKAVDPSTVTVANVVLTCGGDEIGGSVARSFDPMRITFVPSADLPADVTCTLSLDGVQDGLGLAISAGDAAMTFETVASEPRSIQNPHSSYAHTADGAFTDWDEDAAEHEYFDVTPAVGMYSRLYADFDGEQLWLLNDWFYNGDDIDPDCYNQFGVWTDDGQQSWDIRAYGDQRIEVRLNGERLAADDERVAGGYSFSGSPNAAAPHTIYEIAVTAGEGRWGVQLHDPGPTFGCRTLETDPTEYSGTSSPETTVIDPTMNVGMPSAPEIVVQTVESAAPTLRWTIDSALFTSYLVELSSGEDLDDIFFRVVVYGSAVQVPPGLLSETGTYTFRVTAFNLAGSVSSEPVTFTLGELVSPPIEPPSLSGADPTSVTQGSAPTITIHGEGFIEGARAYWNGIPLSTTFVSSAQITAMLTAELTGTAGNFALTVRNDPDDAATESDDLQIAVAEAVSTVATLVSIDPTTATQNVSTPISAMLSGLPDDVTLQMNVTPQAGGAVEVFTCTRQLAYCTANVTVGGGLWNVSIHVAEDGQAAYNTNSVALTVTEPIAACAHSECLPGARLASNCSPCATAVCAAMVACCETGWSTACVEAADAQAACAATCDAPTVNSLAPNEIEEDVEVAITVLTTALPTAGYSYALSLSGPESATFACGSPSGDSCVALVSGLQAGTYSAVLVIQALSGGMPTYPTASLASALTVTEAVTVRFKAF